MSTPLYKIEGYDKFLKAVQTLPDKMKRQETLKLLRRVTKPTIAAAKAKVPEKEGKLKRSIGNITGKSKTYPNVMVGPRAKGKHEGFHGALVECGHGGPAPAPANPYMRPAFDETKGRVTADAVKSIAQYLEKPANKLA